jgi:hypothetical protein
MLEIVLEVCRWVISGIIWQAIIAIVVTPAALLIAAWQRGPYWQNVRANYVKAFEYCDPTTHL